MIGRIILVLATASLLAACPVGGKPKDKVFNSPLCGAVSGYTISYFAYGEGKMVIIPLSKVRAETVFVIGLKPLDGFGPADVTVKGTGANAAWINNTGQHDSLPPAGIYPEGALEVGCVPNDPLGTSYKYMIEVTHGSIKNTLDPRADVVQ